MNRLFFRFFVLVLLSISVAAFIVYFAINRLFGDPLDNIARRQASAQIFLLEQYVDQAPADQWLDRLNKVREVSDVRYELVPLSVVRARLQGHDARAFEQGELVLDVAQKAFYRRVDLKGQRYIGSEEEALTVTNLPIDIGFAMQLETVRYVIVALVLLVPIGFWSRAHWRSLQQLSSVADRFGAGELSARARMQPRDSVYPLAERIDHMADRIERLLAAQRNLLHSVSHEIRTPIARLEFALELLRDAADDPALSRRIDGMAGDLTELKELVNELLGMARLDAGQALQRQPCALEPALRQCVASLPPSAIAIEADFAPGLGEIAADQRLLLRAVGNLLRNALKYANGKVRLAAERDGGAAGNAAVRIMVEDDGPGIPEDERERIFEPFYRLDRSRDRSTGGFGLGLSIASKAVALHGGTLTVDSSPLGGARFTLSLPA
ncbi:MAG TPA: ATP-binding protein [Pseudoduganella sp.]